ncbi:MAG: hypothetical protein [Caudoviricetes sp.]|nr:MAG: hypothetical protein [Caudoviricetes sp.]
MNIEEACKHIGKEVVLDESTEPYKGPLKENHDFGLNVYGIIEDVFKNHKFRLKTQTVTLKARPYTKEELLKIVEGME